MSETVIRISEDGRIMVERDLQGVKSFKQISPDALIKCIDKSMVRGAVHTGLLPKGCVSVSLYDDGSKDVVLLHTEGRADISYFGTVYTSFPLPHLVFGFRLTPEGRVGSCRLGVVENSVRLKPDTKMYHYPLSNVNGFQLCTGNNTFPKCGSLHTLSGLPHYILSMPNNNDHFKHELNKPGLEMRDLLELLKDKEPAFYYSDVLLPSGKVLNDFMERRNC